MSLAPNTHVCFLYGREITVFLSIRLLEWRKHADLIIAAFFPFLPSFCAFGIGGNVFSLNFPKINYFGPMIIVIAHSLFVVAAIVVLFFLFHSVLWHAIRNIRIHWHCQRYECEYNNLIWYIIYNRDQFEAAEHTHAHMWRATKKSIVYMHALIHIQTDPFTQCGIYNGNSLAATATVANGSTVLHSLIHT